MPTCFGHAGTRRAFLKFLVASPLVMMQEKLRGGGEPGAASKLLDALQQAEDLISSPKDAMNVFEFEPVARHKLPPAHFGYIATGVDDDATLRANREGFTRYQIRARRLVDVTNIDMSVRLFGARWNTPIILAPAGHQRAFHPDGEVAVARAAKSKGHLQILSTVTTSSVEEVTAARGAPVWFQLYPTSEWNVTRWSSAPRLQAVRCSS